MIFSKFHSWWRFKQCLFYERNTFIKNSQVHQLKFKNMIYMIFLWKHTSELSYVWRKNNSNCNIWLICTKYVVSAGLLWYVS